MNDAPIEIDVAGVHQMRQQNEEFVLLDVRENDEYAIAKIDGSVLVPMSELRERLSELDEYRDQRIVVHCHHGGRSMQVVQALRAQGFDQAQNMAGGIDQWSLEIDTEVPRY